MNYCQPVTMAKNSYQLRKIFNVINYRWNIKVAITSKQTNKRTNINNNNKHGDSDIQTFIINHEGQVANIAHKAVKVVLTSHVRTIQNSHKIPKIIHLSY